MTNKLTKINKYKNQIRKETKKEIDKLGLEDLEYMNRLIRILANNTN